MKNKLVKAVLLAILVSSVSLQTSFKSTQLGFSRVATAYREKEAVIKKYFTDMRLPYAGFHLFLRAFKKEQLLEVWVRSSGSWHLLQTYSFCTTSGTLGPKRREGDRQIPEGIYHINHFNPQSNFYLSLGLNYPNRSDRILSDPEHPGGSIYIHGNCVTIGCIPITDNSIKELYVLAVEATENGQVHIPVHVFPSRLDDQSLSDLRREFVASPDKITFWEGLKPVYDHFEKTKDPGTVTVMSNGQYLLR